MLEPYELSSVECQSLLRAGVVGRMAFAAADGPHIIPLNYSVVDDAIVVRTTPYSLLAAHAREALVAFEVDHFDQERRSGWSVQARGRCHAVEDVDDLARIQSVWAPQPWAKGVRTLFLRLPWGELTGRRLGENGDTWAEPTARRTQ